MSNTTLYDFDFYAWANDREHGALGKEVTVPARPARRLAIFGFGSALPFARRRLMGEGPKGQAKGDACDATEGDTARPDICVNLSLHRSRLGFNEAAFQGRMT